MLNNWDTKFNNFITKLHGFLTRLAMLSRPIVLAATLIDSWTVSGNACGNASQTANRENYRLISASKQRTFNTICTFCIQHALPNRPVKVSYQMNGTMHGTVIPPCKSKGFRSDCRNYGGTTLLLVPGKVFAHVLLARILPSLLKHRRQPRSGFPPGRFTTQLTVFWLLT